MPRQYYQFNDPLASITSRCSHGSHVYTPATPATGGMNSFPGGSPGLQLALATNAAAARTVERTMTICSTRRRPRDVAIYTGGIRWDSQLHLCDANMYILPRHDKVMGRHLALRSAGTPTCLSAVDHIEAHPTTRAAFDDHNAVSLAAVNLCRIIVDHE